MKHRIVLRLLIKPWVSGNWFEYTHKDYETFQVTFFWKRKLMSLQHAICFYLCVPQNAECSHSTAAEITSKVITTCVKLRVVEHSLEESLEEALGIWSTGWWFEWEQYLQTSCAFTEWIAEWLEGTPKGHPLWPPFGRVESFHTAPGWVTVCRDGLRASGQRPFFFCFLWPSAPEIWVSPSGWKLVWVL